MDLGCSVLFHDSGKEDWLKENNIKLLGDKEYVGISNIACPQEKRYQRKLCRKKAINLELVQHRIRVQDHLCKLKRWKIKSFYRGDVDLQRVHEKQFIVCEIYKQSAVNQFLETKPLIGVAVVTITGKRQRDWRLT